METFYSFFNSNRRIAWLAFVALVLHGLVGVVIVGSPIRLDFGFQDRLIQVIYYLQDRGMPEFINYTNIEFTANVLMFFPLGALLALLFAYRLWWFAPAITFIGSVGIETAQYLFLPGRVPTLSDVLANSIGGLIGAVTVHVVQMVRRRRRKRNQSLQNA